jgi:hypothetical protein
MVLSPIGHLALPPHLAAGRQGDAVFGGITVERPQHNHTDPVEWSARIYLTPNLVALSAENGVR